MFLVEISIYRDQEKPEVREALHAKIRKKIDSDPELQGKSGKVVVEGAINDNPFPTWYVRSLLENSFKFNKTNFSYYRWVKHETDCDDLITWFDGVYRKWIEEEGVKQGMSPEDAKSLQEHSLIRGAEKDKSLDEEGIELY